MARQKQAFPAFHEGVPDAVDAEPELEALTHGPGGGWSEPNWNV